MKTIGNLLWILFGGLVLAIFWMIAGLLCCITLVGIPLGIQCFKFAQLVLWPFGRNIEFGESPFSFLVNIIWILLFGWELAVVSVVMGLLWCITIVGIPFGIQCFKFAQLALLPFGARVVRA